MASQNDFESVLCLSLWPLIDFEKDRRNTFLYVW